MQGKKWESIMLSDSEFEKSVLIERIRRAAAAEAIAFEHGMFAACGSAWLRHCESLKSVAERHFDFLIAGGMSERAARWCSGFRAF
jgi:hypothetical protein